MIEQSRRSNLDIYACNLEGIENELIEVVNSHSSGGTELSKKLVNIIGKKPTSNEYFNLRLKIRGRGNGRCNENIKYFND